MATLYKKPNSPFYYAQFFNADGRRISRSTGTTKKRDAGRIAEGMEADERDVRNKASQLPKAFAVILESVTREAATGSLTLARAEEFVHRLHRLANPEFVEASLNDFWQDWITEQKRHVAATSVAGYDQALASFTDTFGPKIMKDAVAALTPAQVAAAIDKAKKAGGRRSITINKHLACLRRVMDAAVNHKLITSNPAKQARPLRQDDSTEKAPFTVAEIRAMLDHPETSDEWQGAITIAAHTGLRKSDVFSLTRGHIDGTRIIIRPSKTKWRGDKAVVIPLTPPCIAWIGLRQGEFFPALKNANRNGATTSMQFGYIMKRAGVTKVIERPGGTQASRSFHSLRHTFASWLAEADIHADVRQKLTGHSSPGVHARYSHHDGALDRAVGTLPSL